MKGIEKQATLFPARPQMAERTRKQATRTDTIRRPADTHPRISEAVPMVCRSHSVSVSQRAPFRSVARGELMSMVNLSQ